MPLLVQEMIEAPAERLWALLVDTEAWSQWGPSVTGVEIDRRMLRSASTGRVHTVLGISLPFRVTVFEEGRYWRWKVAGIRATGHRITPLGAFGTLLTFEVPWWAAPYALVCKVACARLARLAQAEKEAHGTAAAHSRHQ